jgi:hypothetical protein
MGRLAERLQPAVGASDQTSGPHNYRTQFREPEAIALPRKLELSVCIGRRDRLSKILSAPQTRKEQRLSYRLQAALACAFGVLSRYDGQFPNRISPPASLSPSAAQADCSDQSEDSVRLQILFHHSQDNPNQGQVIPKEELEALGDYLWQRRQLSRRTRLEWQTPNCRGMQSAPFAPPYTSRTHAAVYRFRLGAHPFWHSIAAAIKVQNCQIQQIAALYLPYY